MKVFPTIEEVERADKDQLARWYRFLPSGEIATDQKDYSCGITFTLNVGRLMNLDTRLGCFHEGPNNPVFVSDQVMGKIWEKLATQFNESRKSNSYLEAKAKRFPSQA